MRGLLRLFLRYYGTELFVFAILAVMNLTNPDYDREKKMFELLLIILLSHPRFTFRPFFLSVSAFYPYPFGHIWFNYL